MSRIHIATVFAFLALGANTASAEYIDFSSSTFSGTDGLSTYSYTSAGGTTLTLTPGGLNAKLDWEAGDGFGVQTTGDYETDEIGGAESLTISFANATYLDKVYVTDLFNESGYLEIGYYSLDNAANVTFKATSTQVPGSTNGLKTLNIGDTVSSIKFTAPGKIFFGTQNHEFAVGGISVSGASAVPELDPAPASSALALLVAAGLMLHSRRRKAAAI